MVLFRLGIEPHAAFVNDATKNNRNRISLKVELKQLLRRLSLRRSQLRFVCVFECICMCYRRDKKKIQDKCDTVLVESELKAMTKSLDQF